MQLFHKKLVVTDANVFLDGDIITKEAILQFIVHQAKELGVISQQDEVYNAFVERERESSTGVGLGVAIPHARCKAIKHPSIFLYRANQVIADWHSIDETPIKVAIALFIPERASKDHLKLLSKLAVRLLDEEFVTMLHYTDDKETIAEAINQAISEDPL
ncbi:PTS sugar transporter subunit IIA (plasmid) [Entomospira nematocerorum]|uniref:PTS sugar transporter subunit IIA n=1 Tax=Entomospira nematocerorum TaxID=2719987 RepID=A0A968GIA4_9SPIO|nr:PTS sugar transporter subunit IIA [Entomospira nematocera]NIZ47631.1 PTS sugar transporter subunit IIA [Entomospira nematocera]WDI34635.1 PTS sugar transporter subunit IIA [Entomospira nematocera]